MKGLLKVCRRWWLRFAMPAFGEMDVAEARLEHAMDQRHANRSSTDLRAIPHPPKN